MFVKIFRTIWVASQTMNVLYMAERYFMPKYDFKIAYLDGVFDIGIWVAIVAITSIFIAFEIFKEKNIYIELDDTSDISSEVGFIRTKEVLIQIFLLIPLGFSIHLWGEYTTIKCVVLQFFCTAVMPRIYFRFLMQNHND